MNNLYRRTARTLLVLLLGVLLAACDDSKQEVQALAPTAIHPSDECHVCGMIIADFPGPKGEAVGQGSVKKFCSPAEMLGWWQQPENRHLKVKLYVHDMGRSEWAKPDDNYLIDATQAYYVTGTQLKGAMGVVLASFADEQAARQLAEREGGRVLRFAEIDPSVLQMGAAMDMGMGKQDASQDHQPAAQ
ncbi:nitrous oxide reductase accessory protein NosL [Pseudomonas sp. MMS21-TM103]|uniref:nitrous oxide reductase accessory protein NosL n=1 Tax=Pseudomonas sp. MMS21 TM103 TaxID=2886506 RepID=UPI001EE150D0|nr:nitrous oxide reductase accessory protein NosL [Pseudomonas sp. MMS21 TM103]MCG4455954.1 nitrous oxide reductase accessory protein NosL [Pseudomonas sp. MMS21 TM103]